MSKIVAKGASPDVGNPETYTAEDRIFLRAVLDMQCLRKDLLVKWDIAQVVTTEARRKKRQVSTLTHEGKQLFVEPHTFPAGALVRVGLEANLEGEVMAQSESYLQVWKQNEGIGQ